MSKTRLRELNEELGRIFAEIQDISSQNPSILVHFSDSEHTQSFSSSVDQFDPKLGYFRRQLSKFADKMPSIRKKKKKIV